MQDFKNLAYLRYLLELRFGRRLLDLGTSVQRQVTDGKVSTAVKPNSNCRLYRTLLIYALQSLFEVWMKQASDAIQATARAYAEQG